MKSFIKFGCLATILTSLIGCTPEKESTPPQARQSPESLVTIIQEAGIPSEEPAAWKEKEPSEETRKAWIAEQVQRLQTAAKAAKELHQLYPDHPRALDARHLEIEFLERAFQLGGISELDPLIALFESRLGQQDVPRDQAYEYSAHLMEARAQKLEPEGRDAVMAGYHDGLIQLADQFPEYEDSFRLMMAIAPLLGNDQAEGLARRVLESEATGELLKAKAKGFLIRFDLLGKPLPLECTTLEGKTLRLADLKGKVVLLDFWATWCQPCLQELPSVIDLYAKLHEKGFEIVSISLDTNLSALERMVQEKSILWPQSCDGAGWESPLVEKLGIDALPTMWLLDRQGVLRDIRARENLAEKVQHLLQEPTAP